MKNNSLNTLPGLAYRKRLQQACLSIALNKKGWADETSMRRGGGGGGEGGGLLLAAASYLSLSAKQVARRRRRCGQARERLRQRVFAAAARLRSSAR